MSKTEPLNPDPYMSSSGQRYRNPDPGAKPYAGGPLKAGDWSLDEWRAAELEVFDTRSTYKPDSLSAIYKDIATHLQAKFNRIAAPKVVDSKQEQMRFHDCGDEMCNACGKCKGCEGCECNPKFEEQNGEQELSIPERFCVIQEPDNPDFSERFACKDCGENFIKQVARRYSDASTPGFLKLPDPPPFPEPTSEDIEGSPSEEGTGHG